MRPIPLILTIILKAVTVSAQEIIKEKEFEFYDADTHSLMVGGNVDFQNTFVHKPWPEYYDAFHNLVEFSITNTGTSIVNNPFITLNGSNFYLEPADVDGDLVAGNTFDKRAVQIWKRFTEQVIHRYYPFEGYRQGTPVEMLTGFGYGICYNSAAAITRLSKNENNLFYDLVSFKHSVPEYRIGDRAAVLDGDLKSFYLDAQNIALADKAQISHDRYLIKRSHHYGKQYSYDKGVNDYVAHLYVPNNLYAHTPPEHFAVNYQLVPGEKLTVDYTPGKYFFSEYYFLMDPKEFANGYFQYDWQSAGNDFYLQDQALTNFQINASESRRLVKTNPEEEATLCFKVMSGFQTAFFSFFLESGASETSPSVEISPDSITWISPTAHIIDEAQQVFDFDLQQQSFKGKIYVRVRVGAGESQVDNFGYTAYFQLNRLSLPNLKLGSNRLTLLNKLPKDSLRLYLKYKELTRELSDAVVEAVHPKDNELIAGKINEIVWTNPYPDEEIVNYEFLLTRDTIDGLPLAPNFEMYTMAPPYAYLSIVPSSAGRQRNSLQYVLNPSAYLDKTSKHSSVARSKTLQEKNRFIIHEEGFFNSEQTYYWKVRPLHASGVWGQWSRYFSFSISKVMPPVNLTVENDTLSWQNNPTGTIPVKFQIHASNEYLGFEPTVDNQIAETTENKVAIAGSKNTFFRVIAIDASGERSEMSAYAMRPYPFLNNRPETIKPDSLLEYKPEFTRAYYSWVSIGDSLISHTDQITFSVSSMPGWLQYNDKTGELEGSTTEETLKEEFYHRKNSIDFIFKSEIFAEPRQYSMQLPYVFDNYKPELRSIDTTLYARNSFSFSIPYLDQDKKYGDSVFFVLKNRPDWLKFHWSEDSISFYGEPKDTGVFKIAVIAEDKYGDTTRVQLRLNILPHEIYYTVAAPSDNNLSMSMDTILLSNGIMASTVNISGHSISGFQLAEAENILTLTGDFCTIETARELQIPFELLTSSSRTPLKLKLNLTLTNSGVGKGVHVFHPMRSDVLIIQDESCPPREFEYVLLNYSGRAVRRGRCSSFDTRECHLQIDNLPPGIYVIMISNGTTRQSGRFIRQ